MQALGLSLTSTILTWRVCIHCCTGDHKLVIQSHKVTQTTLTFLWGHLFRDFAHVNWLFTPVLGAMYSPWAYNQPDQYGNYQYCGVVHTRNEYQLADEGCGQQYEYICHISEYIIFVLTQLISKENGSGNNVTHVPYALFSSSSHWEKHRQYYLCLHQQIKFYQTIFYTICLP